MREKILVAIYTCDICRRKIENPQHWSTLSWLEEAESGDIEVSVDLCEGCSHDAFINLMEHKEWQRD